jgi:hypothetical protein
MRLLLGLVSVLPLPKRPLSLLPNPIAQSLVADTAAHGRTKFDPPMPETGEGDCCAIAAPEARQSASVTVIRLTFMV